MCTKIKFCGLRRLCDIEYANRLHPDYIGFVFAPASRRFVTPEAAKALKQHLDLSISAVGVFVNEDPELIVRMLQDGIIDLAQLHGTEDETYIRNLREKIQRTHLHHNSIIKAFSIRSREDIRLAQSCCADALLLDAGSGGTGTAFDWNLLQYMNRPYFLAGGLTIENLPYALQKIRPYAIDVSSGIETDGWKDYIKMETFINLIHDDTR